MVKSNNKYYSYIFKKFRKNITGIIGAFFVLIMFILAIFAAYISPYSPIEINLSLKLQPPGVINFLGTDQFGRDILSRIIWGSQISIALALITVVISMTIGVIMGVLSGYYSNWIGNLIMRVTDVLLCFPILLMALALVAVLGPQLINIMVAVAVALTPQFARIVRSVVLSIKEQLYVEASIGLGAKPFYIIMKHIIPNTIPPIIVVATLNVATAILIESSLSFLGLGIQPPTASWGTIIADGRKWINEAPWISAFSGVAIMFTVLGFNLLGDALRDILDPRLRGT